MPLHDRNKNIKIDNREIWSVNKKVSCETSNVIYMIECQKNGCKEKRYIGETKRPLKYRLADHRGYVNNHITSQATGSHFNSPGHSLTDLKITILELVKYRNTAYRKEREKYFIRKFNTYHEGLNKKV